MSNLGSLALRALLVAIVVAQYALAVAPPGGMS